ncbi:MAG: MBL fold metallo-hydrolase, partial [Streptosporangiaceae bacterium]
TARRLARAQGVDGEEEMTGAFDFRDLQPGPLEIGPLRLTPAHMNHPVETFGFRFEAGGAVLAYSADTGESADLVTLARDADVLLSEASFLEGPDLPQGLHLTARQAAEHATRAGAQHLILTHLVPWNDRDRSRDEAAGAFGGQLTLATSGLVVDLG